MITHTHKWLYDYTLLSNNLIQFWLCTHKYAYAICNGVHSFSDFLQGHPGLPSLVYSWIRLIMARENNRSMKEKDTGAICRNPWTGFWFCLPLVLEYIKYILSPAVKKNNNNMFFQKTWANKNVCHVFFPRKTY